MALNFRSLFKWMVPAWLAGEGNSSDTPPEIVNNALDQADRISEAAAGTQAAPTVEALMADAKTMDEIERIANDAGVGVPIR